VKGNTGPAAYAAWYHTPRGRWIGAQEFDLLQRLIQPASDASLLDVGCGTGYFTRRFAGAGLKVIGLDPDLAALQFARSHNGRFSCLQGDAASLPFADAAFDHVAAITSLCFVADPLPALQELWRVANRSVVLGLLNRHSLLHQWKQDRGGYRGARWDTAGEVLADWIPHLEPAPRASAWRTAIFLPRGQWPAQWLERVLPGRLPWGGFLAVYLEK